MLDNKKIGIKIGELRKTAGLSQEKLANILHISAQAISKWENGHSLPETSLLPILSQIFQCSIDEILMIGYEYDKKIENNKSTILEQQAEHIAKHVVENLKNEIVLKEKKGFNDNIIINALKRVHGNIDVIEVKREKPIKYNGIIETNISVKTPEKEFNLFEKILGNNTIELDRYRLLSKYNDKLIPQIYCNDDDEKALLMENFYKNYIGGHNFNENNEHGQIFRSYYKNILSAIAEFHATFWENNEVFDKVGLDWRLESEENLIAHISGMEKDFRKYKKNEESGKIPKNWKIFENNIDLKDLDCFEEAIKFMKNEYVKLINSRFHAAKNITVIHGDLHPGAICLSKNPEKNVKFVGLQALRMGLCTEDFAMFLALHIEPEKKNADNFLEIYYKKLCEKVKNYSFETFIDDYKISIAENMFFTIRHINYGIFDFNMRDKSIKAFKTFVLEN